MSRLCTVLLHKAGSQAFDLIKSYRDADRIVWKEKRPISTPFIMAALSRVCCETMCTLTDPASLTVAEVNVQISACENRNRHKHVNKTKRKRPAA